MYLLIHIFIIFVFTYSFIIYVFINLFIFMFMYVRIVYVCREVGRCVCVSIYVRTYVFIVRMFPCSSACAYSTYLCALACMQIFMFAHMNVCVRLGLFAYFSFFSYSFVLS